MISQYYETISKTCGMISQTCESNPQAWGSLPKLEQPFPNISESFPKPRKPFPKFVEPCPKPSKSLPKPKKPSIKPLEPFLMFWKRAEKNGKMTIEHGDCPGMGHGHCWRQCQIEEAMSGSNPGDHGAAYYFIVGKTGLPGARNRNFTGFRRDGWSCGLTL